MYHPQVIASNISTLEAQWKLTLRYYSTTECQTWADRLSDAVSPKGQALRPLTLDEQGFISNELLLCSTSFQYWAERYAKINVEGRGVDTMFPLLDSQSFILSKISDLELACHLGDRVDGILFNVLKAARQVGISTLAEALAAHRLTTQNNIFGLVASDVPESSAFMFDILERIVEHLPWWIHPRKLEHVKNSEILFEGGSHIWVGAGKSTRGTTGARGQLGRGKSLSFVHLSELSTWEDASQIDDALLPTMAISPRTFAILESTAKGRGNWWHTHWQETRNGRGRFVNIFIPWFAEPKYSLPAPTFWTPALSTIQHGNRCTEVSPRWLGRTVTPTRDQLYWYESTRAYFEAKNNLHQFLEEYGAVDDDECFQHGGVSIFDAATLERVQQQLRPLAAFVEVAPMSQLR